jgi:ParB-like chromosome segregation protein Spo0J
MAASVKVQYGKNGLAGDAPRRDFFILHPFDILRPEVKEGSTFHNRRYAPVPDAEIMALAQNMMAVGNLEPVQCRKIAGFKPGEPSVELVFGFSRHRAAELIAKELRPNEPVLLKVILTEISDDEAALNNIAENRFRNRTTPLDDAINQRWMREDKGKTEEEIASFYKMNLSRVSRLRKLLLLAQPIRDAIASRLIEAEAAIELADMSEDQQLALFEDLKKNHSLSAHYDEDTLGVINVAPLTTGAVTNNPSPNRTGKKPVAPNGGGKKRAVISTAEVKKAVRKIKAEAGEKGPALTLRNVKEFFLNLDVPNEDLVVREFAKKFVNFVAGDITEKQFANAVYKIRDETAERKAE